MKKILIIILCLTLVFILVACDTDDKNKENKQSADTAETTCDTVDKDTESKQPDGTAETTTPPGYHSLNITMTTDETYSTEPYASFIPSKEAMESAGFINSRNGLIGEPENEKPWTCLISSWKTPTSSTNVFYVTVMHINCQYPYGANSSDNTPQTLTFDGLEDTLSPNSKQRYVTVRVGDYVATYECNSDVDITAEELYALITSAPCFNTAE